MNRRWWGLAAALGTVGVGTWAYSFFVEPRWFRIVRHDLTLPRLDPAFDGYRILHLSDLHVDNVTLSRERLHALAAQLNPLEPDLVVITGDIVTHLGRRFGRQAAEGLIPFEATDGKIAVLGNHDHWTAPDHIAAMLEQNGVRVLRNAVHTLQRGDALLHIAGVDDAYERTDDLPAVLAQLPEAGAAVLLAHEPDFADTAAATGRFGLQLSGHSHGGQVCWPGGRPIWLPNMGQQYPVGLYELETVSGKMWLFTSRGTGSLTPNVRLNCRPEVALITLRACDVPSAAPR
jgi:predicted MPP superfamily phosphohydrolase